MTDGEAPFESFCSLFCTCSHIHSKKGAADADNKLANSPPPLFTLLYNSACLCYSPLVSSDVIEGPPPPPPFFPQRERTAARDGGGGGASSNPLFPLHLPLPPLPSSFPLSCTCIGCLNAAPPPLFPRGGSQPEAGE